jgi:serine phosphatase RsbU (regulator of sigma subunit)
MRIRSQLITALFLLAVLPLAGIVIYSYSSSLSAVREAVAVEAGALTNDMERRMETVQADIERRVQRLGAAPFRSMSMGSEHQSEWEREELMGEVLTELGEAAPLIYSFEFIPGEPAGLAPVSEVAEVASPDLPTPSRPAPRMIEMHQIMEEVAARLQEMQGEIDHDLMFKRAEAGIEAAAARLEVASKISLQVEERSQPAPPSPSAEVSAVPQEPLVKGDGEWEWQAPAEEKLRIYRRFHEEFETSEGSSGEWQALELSDQDPEGPLGEPILFSLREEGKEVAKVKTQISGALLLRRVLAQTQREQGEVPFALDQEGHLYALNEEDREMLDDLHFPARGSQDGAAESTRGDWVIVTSAEDNTGLTFGIARPIRDSLRQVRRTAATNFGYGLVVIGLAVIGIRPISNRITRDLQAVTAGAQRIAQGDLDTQVPITSKNEIGQLAQAFNSMAFDLKDHQGRLVQEEHKRRDQEVQQRLLKAEFDRKSEELEEARLFQLSLLPRQLPEHPSFDLAVAMKTATEVGGDYYDFRLAEGGDLTCAIGDATGHGLKAGTMVTVTKSLFSAYSPATSLSEFLGNATAAIRRMELGRMVMALQLARFDGARLTLASAGMPPALLWRASSGSENSVEEITLSGMPLGGLDFDYQERRLDVGSGDTLLLMTDGFPELLNADGDPFGYPAARQAFGRVAHETPSEIIASLEQTAEEWAGSKVPNDDLTFVVLRVS